MNSKNIICQLDFLTKKSIKIILVIFFTFELNYFSKL